MGNNACGPQILVLPRRVLRPALPDNHYIAIDKPISIKYFINYTVRAPIEHIRIL